MCMSTFLNVETQPVKSLSRIPRLMSLIEGGGPSARMIGYHWIYGDARQSSDLATRIRIDSTEFLISPVIWTGQGVYAGTMQGAPENGISFEYWYLSRKQKHLDQIHRIDGIATGKKWITLSIING
jgi:hypothetical protein